MRKFNFWGLTVFERRLWIISLLVIMSGYLLVPEGGALNLLASLIGVTSLILIARGMVSGQIMMVLFSVLYGVISFEQRYYGEMITYLGMTAPIAAMAVVSWLRHPFQDSAEVAVNVMTSRQKWIVALGCVGSTVVFHVILSALGTANLFFSTLSVSTSFLGASLTYFRSPTYALGYAANDVVLVVLWVMAAMEDLSCLVMVACFCVFLVNDLYGYFSWQKMKQRQTSICRKEITSR